MNYIELMRKVAKATPMTDGLIGFGSDIATSMPTAGAPLIPAIGNAIGAIHGNLTGDTRTDNLDALTAIFPGVRVSREARRFREKARELTGKEHRDTGLSEVMGTVVAPAATVAGLYGLSSRPVRRLFGGRHSRLGNALRKTHNIVTCGYDKGGSNIAGLLASSVGLLIAGDIAGTAVGGILAGKRSDDKHRKYVESKGHVAANYLIPGAASYNRARTFWTMEDGAGGK